MLIREIYENICLFEDQNKANALIKKYPDLAQEINERFDWAKTTLKSNQLILWYLNFMDAIYSGNAQQMAGGAYPLGDSTSKFTDLDSLQIQLEHYFASTYADRPLLKRYKQVAGKSLQQVMTDLAEIERAIQAEDAKSIEKTAAIPIQPDDKIVVPMRDGDWWLLPRNACTDESKFMGHCGTAQNPDNFLLSLRDKTPRPHLTFEYNQPEKELFQMKGKNNQKPAPAYHYAIFNLLMSDVVSSVYSGKTYQPSSDFSIFDMKEELVLKIAQDKPSLITDQINKYPIDFLRAPVPIKSNPEYYKLAISKAPGITALMTATGEIDNSNEAWQNAITKDKSIVIYAPESIDNYKELVINAISRQETLMGYVPNTIKNNFDMMSAIIDKKPSTIMYIQPTHKKYKELATIAVNKNGSQLHYISEEFRTPELCKLAVTNTGLALSDVPEQLLTTELCKLAVTNNGTALSYVPEQLRTPELCKVAVSNNGMSIQSVPEELRTPELCKMAVSATGWALLYVPVALRTPELCKLAVTNNGTALDSVPEELRTPEVCKAAVTNDARAFTDIPKELRTPELCKLAVSTNSEMLYYIPTEARTPEVCRVAVANDGRALRNVPAHLHTPEMYKLAAGSAADAMRYIPTEARTTELYKIATTNDGMALKYVPSELVVPLSKVAVKKTPLSILYVPIESISASMVKYATRELDNRYNKDSHKYWEYTEEDREGLDEDTFEEKYDLIGKIEHMFTTREQYDNAMLVFNWLQSEDLGDICSEKITSGLSLAEDYHGYDWDNPDD